MDLRLSLHEDLNWECIYIAHNCYPRQTVLFVCVFLKESIQEEMFREKTAT